MSRCSRSPHPSTPSLVRVVDATETTAWAPGTIARVLGWGEIEGGDLSDVLRTGDVVIRDDADCPNANFDASVMLCAAGTPAEGDENPCQSDSGSPLLVPDGTLYALAGVFSGASCATEASPGIFARVGDGPLNAWVHSRTPEADFTLSHQPRVNEAVTLTQTSRVPTGDPPFTIFRWDLDNDGAFDDATGASISHTYTQVGEAVAGLEASTAAGDKAVVYYAFDVEPNPNVVPPAQTPTGPGHDHRAADHEPRREPAAGHDPQRQAAQGPRRALPDPHPLRQGRADRDRGDRGLPRQAPDRHRPHEGQARRDQARPREADADRPADPAPRRQQAAEDPRARPRRAQAAADQAADDQALTSSSCNSW